MTTIASSDIVFSASAISDEDPFNAAALGLTASGVGTIVSSGSWRVRNTGDTIGGFGYAENPSDATVGAVARIAAGTGGRYLWLCMLDSSGNGYAGRINFADYRFCPVTAFVPGSITTFHSPGAPAAGDEYAITANGTTLTTYKNGAEVGTSTITAGTYRPWLIFEQDGTSVFVDTFGAIGYEPTGPAINPTGTDTDLINGTSASVVFSGLTSNPASVAVVWDNGVDSAISSTQADFSLGTVTAGVATATVTATIGNLPYTDATYLTADYSYLVTCADASEITLDTLTFAPEAGRAFITLASPLNDSTSIIPSETLATGEQIEYPTTVSGDTFTVNADGSFNVVYAGSPQELTFNLGYWDGSTWYTIATTLNISGEVVSGGGLTRVGLTRIGLTTAGLTAVGFSSGAVTVGLIASTYLTTLTEVSNYG